MTNKHTSLNNCGKCNINKADCQTCKLAALNLDKNAKRKVRIDDEDDDPSISERLTENKNDHSILLLFVVAVATFAAVIGFTMLFK